jgi:hypothetical protein
MTTWTQNEAPNCSDDPSPPHGGSARSPVYVGRDANGVDWWTEEHVSPGMLEWWRTDILPDRERATNMDQAFGK